MEWLSAEIDLQQQVLDDHRQPEGDQQRGEEAARKARLEQRALEDVAHHGEHRHHDHERRQRRNPG